MLESHPTGRRGRAPSRPPHDEREPAAVCDTGPANGDGNGSYDSDDMSTNTTSDAGPANIEAWKLLGGLLSKIGSQGWSDSECLSWMRETVQAMQSGSPAGRATKSENKRSATETLGLERVKRPRIIRGLHDTDADTAVDEDGRMAAGDMDDDDDDSDWDAGDDSDCFSDTSCDDDKEDRETLATIFETLKERAASKMASRAATQNSPSVTMPKT